MLRRRRSYFPDTPAGRSHARLIARQGRGWAAFKQRHDHSPPSPSLWAIWPRAILLTIKEFVLLPVLLVRLPFTKLLPARDDEEMDLAYSGTVIEDGMRVQYFGYYDAKGALHSSRTVLPDAET